MRSRTPGAWLPSTRACCRSAWRVLSPLVLLFLLSAPVSPTAIAQDADPILQDAAASSSSSAASPPPAPPQTRAVAACAGDVRLFLELSVMGLVTVGLAAAAMRCASHCRRLRRPQQRQDKQGLAACPSPSPSLSSGPLTAWTLASRFAESIGVNTARRRILSVVGRAVAALSIAVFGITGLVFASSPSTPADADAASSFPSALHECDAWEAGAAVTVGCCCLLVALWLLVSLATDVLTKSLIQPPNETPAALKCFRCSCCSFALARVLALLPLAALAALAARSWLRARSSSTSSCEPKVAMLLAGAALVFTLMTATTAAMIVLSSLSDQEASCFPFSWCRQRSRDADSSKASAITGDANRRATRLIVAFTFVLLALAAITWGVLGLVWLSPSQDASSTGSTGCSSSVDTSATTDEAKMCVVAMLVVGTVLLATTVCCRLESFFLATGATPSVDALMLSPSLGATNRTERIVGQPSSSANRDTDSTPKPQAAATPRMIAML